MNQQVTTPINDKYLTTVANCLQEVGLNLTTALSAKALSPEIWLEPPVAAGGTILLLGNGGQEFWHFLENNWPNSDNPVDDYSARVSGEVLAQCLPAVERKLLFPAADCALVLQRLMTAAGWHSRSPLGMGMHSRYGLWSACRAVWWLDVEITPQVESVTTTDHCLSCTDKPCLAACPADALSEQQPPLLSRCADYRLAQGSHCANTCLAREACPVATNHRYKPEQLNYHYGLARSAIATYRSSAHSDDGD